MTALAPILIPTGIMLIISGATSYAIVTIPSHTRPPALMRTIGAITALGCALIFPFGTAFIASTLH